jgi:V8-like Glu-specific endopeptidase
MMKAKELLLLLLGLSTLYIAAQKRTLTDSIVLYDVYEKTTIKLPPAVIDTTTNSDRTPANGGSLPNTATLLSAMPPANSFPGCNFSDLTRASSLFNLSYYPLRCAVTFNKYKNGFLTRLCTGMMVGSEFVVSAGHCFYDSQTLSPEYDSIIVLPAFDNGVPNNNLPLARVTKMYYLQSSYFGDEKDAVLLQLDHPIGEQLGWIGLAYEELDQADANFYQDKVFHKLSYPGVVSPWDSTKVYNGDTMYYNYGEITYLWNPNSTYLGVNSSSAQAIPGMSGSSLFHLENDKYFTFGIGIWSNYYSHNRFYNNLYFAFKKIVEVYTTSVGSQSEVSSVRMFPNPMSEQLTIVCPRFDQPSVKVFDCTGAETKVQTCNYPEKIILNRGDLRPGIYLVKVTYLQEETVLKLVVENN